MKKYIVCALLVFTSCTTGTKSSNNIANKFNIKTPPETTTGSPLPNQETVSQTQQSLTQLSSEDQLLKITIENSEARKNLKATQEQLIHCETDVANPLLGGNGKIPQIAEVDAAMDESKMKTTLGLDEHAPLALDLKDLLQDRIDRQNKIHSTLNSNIEIVRSYLTKCLATMKTVRAKHGLKPTWYTADPKKGYRQETNLNIGFSNAAKDNPPPVPDFSKAILLTPPF